MLKEYEQEFARVYGGDGGLYDDLFLPPSRLPSRVATRPYTRAEPPSVRFDHALEGAVIGSGIPYLQNGGRGTDGVLIGTPVQAHRRQAPTPFGGAPFGHSARTVDDATMFFDGYPQWALEEKVHTYGHSVRPIY